MTETEYAELVTLKNERIVALELQVEAYRKALEEISRLESGMTAGGRAAWIAQAALGANA